MKSHMFDLIQGGKEERFHLWVGKNSQDSHFGAIFCHISLLTCSQDWLQVENIVRAARKPSLKDKYQPLTSKAMLAC